MERRDSSANFEQSLNPCNEQPPLSDNPINDPPNKQCGPSQPNLNNPGTVQDAWNAEQRFEKTGLGRAVRCDPMQTGQILNDPNDKNTKTIYRYTQAIRGADEAMLDMFRGIYVLDEDGKAHQVPIIWATQEKAVAAILQSNFRKDNSLVVDRIRLPILSIHQSDLQFNQERYTFHGVRRKELIESGKPGFTVQEKRIKDTVFSYSRGIPIDIGYTLYAWTLYLEDMNHIVEQILPKFSPLAYIQIRGVHWEVPVRLDSTGNNTEMEPGDQAIRVIKWQFNMTAQSYIPQPIRRDKAVLRMKTTFTEGGPEESGIRDVIGKTEVAAKELEE